MRPVSHTTFFRYFSSKEQVVLSDDLDDVRAQVIAGVPGTEPFRFRPGAGPRAVHRGQRRPVGVESRTPAADHTEPALRVSHQLESDRAIYDGIDVMADYLGVDRANPRLRVFAAAVGG